MRFLRWMIVTGAVLGLAWALAGIAVTQWLVTRLQAPQSPLQAQFAQADGAPYRIGLNAEGLTLHQPDGTLKLAGGRLRALLWDPLDLMLAPRLPLEFQTATGLDVKLTAYPVTTRLALSYAPDLPIRCAHLTLTNPQLAILTPTAPPETTQIFGADRVTADVRRTSHDIYQAQASASRITLPPGYAQTLAPGSDLSDRIEQASASARATFNVLPSLRGPQPVLRSLEIGEMSVLWGGRDLDIKGTLTFDQNGLPSGTLRLSTHDWEGWFDVAKQAGWLGRGEKLAHSLLQALANNAPDGVLTLPLGFRKGEMSLGPIPLGTAPWLR